MANILDPMDLKQIITLHLDGSSNRRIGSILGISRNTVNNYMRLFTASGYSLQELLDFDPATLSGLFSSHTTVDTDRHNELMLYFEGVNSAPSHLEKNLTVAFFNFINQIYEHTSIVITTNKKPTEWAKMLDDEVIATALLDRLLFRCEVINLTGKSYRLENRKTFFEN